MRLHGRNNAMSLTDCSSWDKIERQPVEENVHLLHQLAVHEIRWDCLWQLAENAAVSLTFCSHWVRTIWQENCCDTHSLLVIGSDVVRLPGREFILSLTVFWPDDIMRLKNCITYFLVSMGIINNETPWRNLGCDSQAVCHQINGLHCRKRTISHTFCWSWQEVWCNGAEGSQVSLTLWKQRWDVRGLPGRK